jgi:hypothetical protein
LTRWEILLDVGEPKAPIETPQGDAKLLGELAFLLG